MANEELKEQIDLEGLLNGLIQDQNSNKKYGNSTIEDRVQLMQQAAAAEDDISKLSVVQNDLKTKHNKMIKDGKKGLAGQYGELLKSVSKKIVQLKIEEKQSTLEESKLKASIKNVSEMNKMSKSALTLFGLSGGIVGLFTMFNKMTATIGKNFGALGMQNEKFKKDIMAAGVTATKLGQTIEEVAATSKELTDNFGFGRDESLKIAENVIDTSLALGLSNQEGATLIGSLMQISGLSLEAADNFAKQTASLADAEGVSPTTVLRDLAKSSKAIAMFTGMTPDNLAKAAIQATKLGTTLDAIANSMEGMLNFQDSLNNEITASIMLGRNVNLQKARELALAGKADEFAVELTKQVGSQAEFQAMLLPQRQALAKALGMDVQQLAKMVSNQEKVKTLGDAIAEQDGLEKLIGREALDKTAKIINDLKAVGAELAVSIGPTVASIAGGFASITGALQQTGFLIPIITGLLSAMAAKSILNFAFSIATMLGKQAAFMGPAGIAYALGIPALVGTMIGGIMSIASFQDLPVGQGANLKAGAALFHPGETVVNDVDLKQLASGGGGTSDVMAKQTEKTNRELISEIKAMRNENQSYFGSGGSVPGTITRGFETTIRNA